ncbi:MAG: hypothetical protein RIR00_956, partial [Pseudomonadota bacterium]
MLLLVDGSSYLYRAYHGLPDLRNAAGEPTGAIYGVLAMLRRLESDFKADYRAVVFDAKGKTFRDDWYPEYKANRPPMPEDLVCQIEPLHRAIRASGWPLLMESGVEADDVIGTLAQAAVAAGLDVMVSTGDKDMAQLVGPQVRLVNTMSNETLDRDAVIAKFGVPPERIVDYLALIGDSVDNVPGVPRCGPKTACKWLSEYDDLAGVIANADRIKGVVGENLRGHLAFLPLGQRLVTIRCDLPDLPAPTSLHPTAPDQTILQQIYERYEFRNWLRGARPAAEANPVASAETPATPTAAPAPAEPAAAIQSEAADTPGPAPDAHRSHYQTLLDWPALESWLAKLDTAPLVALDCETTSLSSLDARLVGISFAVAPGEAAYLPLGHCGPDLPQQLPLDPALQRLRPWLENPARPKVLQNAKYDQHVFANHGIALAGIAHDTLLQSYVLESDKGHDLEQLASRHLGLATISYTELCGKGAKQIGFDQVDLERAAAYAAEDADLTWRLNALLLPQLGAEAGLQRVYADIELPAREVLFQMERTGVLIDSALLQRHSHELGQKLLELEQEAYQLA